MRTHVAWQVRLDYDEYLTDPDRYDAEFSADVAGQLGIRVARIVVEKTAPGSTVRVCVLLSGSARDERMCVLLLACSG
jgi:hypothetical protein